MKTTLAKALFLITLCATGHAQEQSAAVPLVLVASIDEWKGASYRVQLTADGTIVYSDNLAPGPRHTRMKVSGERWRSFRRHLDSANVWSWRPEYIDVGVADGTGWNVHIVYPDRKITSSGSNAYPPKNQFDEFRAAVRELLGGKPFE